MNNIFEGKRKSSLKKLNYLKNKKHCIHVPTGGSNIKERKQQKLQK